jgi:hypothetical protein
MRDLKQVKPVGIPFGRIRNAPPPRNLRVAAERIRRSQIFGEWVSAGDQAPSVPGEYLVLLRGNHCRVMEYSRDRKAFLPMSLDQTVTHWMALPPAPPGQA